MRSALTVGGGCVVDVVRQLLDACVVLFESELVLCGECLHRGPVLHDSFEFREYVSLSDWDCSVYVHVCEGDSALLRVLESRLGVRECLVDPVLESSRAAHVVEALELLLEVHILLLELLLRNAVDVALS